jgi:transposase
MPNRKPYPSDVSDEEWAFAAPYLALMREDAPQRVHDLREVLNGLRWIVRTGSPWRYMPNDLPPWEAVYQQTQRWLKAGVFEAMVHDLREVLRLAQGRAPDPSAAVLDSRTLRSTPESGHRAGYDGAKRKRGSKVHAAVDTLGHLLALRVTPATEQDRAQVGALAEAVREATGESVELAYVDRRGAGGGGRRAGREAGGRDAPRGEEGLRPLAAEVGGGALLRVGRALPQAGQGLRKVAGDRRRVALRGLRLPHAPSRLPRSRPRSITRSSQ